MPDLKVNQAEPAPTYYVVRMDDKGRPPRKRYPGRNMAYKAAESMARRNPGVEFVVVKLKTTMTFSPE